MECELIGRLCGDKWKHCIDMVRRVYSVDGIAPTILTFSGGNTETKILEHRNGIQADKKKIKNAIPLHSGNETITRIPQGSRIRRITERECFKLMGVKDADYERVAQNQSRGSLYHLAGDSIVTNVLSAIFTQML